MGGGPCARPRGCYSNTGRPVRKAAMPCQEAAAGGWEAAMPRQEATRSGRQVATTRREAAVLDQESLPEAGDRRSPEAGDRRSSPEAR
eukprot:g44088.t1